MHVSTSVPFHDPSFAARISLSVEDVDGNKGVSFSPAANSLWVVQKIVWQIVGAPYGAITA
jgi:hypothetical protein